MLQMIPRHLGPPVFQPNPNSHRQTKNPPAPAPTHPCTNVGAIGTNGTKTKRPNNEKTPPPTTATKKWSAMLPEKYASHIWRCIWKEYGKKWRNKNVGNPCHICKNPISSSPTGVWCNVCGFQDPCPCWSEDHIGCYQHMLAKSKENKLPIRKSCCCGELKRA